MKTPPSPLSAALVSKGSAVPSSAMGENQAAHAPSGPGPLMQAPDAEVRSPAVTYHKALTVKLDEARYRALKLAGLEIDRSSQEILVEALDEWLRARRN